MLESYSGTINLDALTDRTTQGMPTCRLDLSVNVSDRALAWIGIAVNVVAITVTIVGVAVTLWFMR